MENQIKPTCAYVDAHLLCLTDEVAQKAPHKWKHSAGLFFCDGRRKPEINGRQLMPGYDAESAARMSALFWRRFWDCSRNCLALRISVSELPSARLFAAAQDPLLALNQAHRYCKA